MQGTEIGNRMRLRSLHEVLGESRFEGEPPALETCSFRLDPMIEDQVREICRQNSTTLSKFLRSCCLRLLQEYR